MKNGVVSYVEPVKKTLQASATKTANFNTSSTSDGRLWQACIFVVTISSLSGSATLDLTIQGSADDSTWVSYDSIQISQISADGQYVLYVDAPLLHKYVRLTGVVGGGTPSLDVAANLWAFGPDAS